MIMVSQFDPVNPGLQTHTYVWPRPVIRHRLVPSDEHVLYVQGSLMTMEQSRPVNSGGHVQLNEPIVLTQ